MMQTSLRGELTVPDLHEAQDINFNDVIASSLKMTSAKEAQQVRDVFFPAAMCAAAREGNLPQLLFLERQVAKICFTPDPTNSQSALRGPQPNSSTNNSTDFVVTPSNEDR